MSFEQPLPKTENPETRRYEYRDAEGKKIAEVEAGYARAGDMLEDPILGALPAARLTSLKLANPEDGRVFDVLAAFNPKEVSLLVPESRIMNYSCSIMGDEAIVPAPESPLDLATTLHELGHSEQFTDPATEGFAGFSGVSRAFMTKDGLRSLGLDDAQRLHAAKGHLQAVFAAIPEAREAADPAAVSAFETAATMSALEAATSKLKDILALPLRMAERDATRRALQGLRRIREEAGIDLLSKTLNPKEALLSAAEGCEAATAEGLERPDDYVVVSTVAAMKGDLKTYGAEKFRIKK